jgi:hypothetical protein
MDNTRNDLKINYLGKFESEFENNLGYESGEHVGSFDD